MVSAETELDQTGFEIKSDSCKLALTILLEKGHPV